MHTCKLYATFDLPYFLFATVMESQLSKDNKISNLECRLDQQTLEGYIYIYWIYTFVIISNLIDLVTLLLESILFVKINTFILLNILWITNTGGRLHQQINPPPPTWWGYVGSWGTGTAETKSVSGNVPGRVSCPHWHTDTLTRSELRPVAWMTPVLRMLNYRPTKHTTAVAERSMSGYIVQTPITGSLICCQGLSCTQDLMAVRFGKRPLTTHRDNVREPEIHLFWSLSHIIFYRFHRFSDRTHAVYTLHQWYSTMSTSLQNYIICRWHNRLYYRWWSTNIIWPGKLDTCRLNNWLKANHLYANLSKTKRNIIYRSDTACEYDLDIFIDDEKLERVHCTILLGLFIETAWLFLGLQVKLPIVWFVHICHRLYRQHSFSVATYQSVDCSPRAEWLYDHIANGHVFMCRHIHIHISCRAWQFLLGRN